MIPLIRAEVARKRVNEKKDALDAEMQKARKSIAEMVETAVDRMQCSIRIPACWVQRWPKEIWQELEDLGYVLEHLYGYIDVKW